jgi:hypothetical protein
MWPIALLVAGSVLALVARHRLSAIDRTPERDGGDIEEQVQAAEGSRGLA